MRMGDNAQWISMTKMVAPSDQRVMGHEFEWKYWEQEGFVLQWESWSGCFGVASETPLVSVRVIFPVVFGTLES